MKRLIFFACATLFIGFSHLGYAAIITLEEAAAKGVTSDDGDFQIYSYATMNFFANPSEWFSADLGFTITAEDAITSVKTAKDEIDLTATINRARFSLRMKNAPCGFGVFLFNGGSIGSSEVFDGRVGSGGDQKKPALLFSRLISAQKDYDGLHHLKGSGIWASCDIRPISGLTELYIYANDDFSADLRFAVSKPTFMIDLFAGTSLTSESCLLRGGVTAFLTNKAGAELYVETGVTSCEPGDSDVMENLFFLFEPRLRLKRTILSMAFFHRPRYYNGVDTGVANCIDWNILRIQFGSAENGKAEGGFEATVQIIPEESPAPIISPFFAKKIGAFKLYAAADFYPMKLFSDSDDGESSGIMQSLRFELALKAAF